MRAVEGHAAGVEQLSGCDVRLGWTGVRSRAGAVSGGQGLTADESAWAAGAAAGVALEPVSLRP